MVTMYQTERNSVRNEKKIKPFWVFVEIKTSIFVETMQDKLYFIIVLKS